MKKTIAKSLFFIAIFFAKIAFSQETLDVDVLPTNIGGKAEFKRFFEQELIYPSSSLKLKIGGKVTFNFTINKDSSITNLVASESGAPDINFEAMRLFKLIQWIPAVKDGQYVNTKWTITFDFNPDKYAKICKERGFKTFQYPAKSIIDSSGIIYKMPDQMPMYPKGSYALQDFIKENLEYPRQAQLSNIQGTVVLRFIVEPTGLVTNIGVEKSLGAGCNEEAIRVLQLIKWYPGTKDGKLSRVQMSFPFYFVLNEDFKDNSAGEQK